MEVCKICNEEFDNLKALSAHVTQKHNITSKEYYDKYLKKEGEGECVVCGKETTYRNAGTGYLKNCSAECRDKNKDIKRDYWKGKKQSKETIEKRIKNTDQQKKEECRKQTMLETYGVDNPTKMDFVKKLLSEKATGRELPRTKEWQNKIIKSKRNNGTLKHSEETKNKISKKLKNYYQNDKDRSKFISHSTNKRHMCGWYNDIYFRSSLELSFLIQNSDKYIKSCETKEYGIEYYHNDKRKIYYPDFTDGEIIYEIKPSSLLNYKDNVSKISIGKEKYGDKYQIITEKECPYVSKEIIFDYICKGIVKLNEHSIFLLENNYKH